MTELAGRYASALRGEIAERNEAWARGRAHVESYGPMPVMVYAPEEGRHGNFFDDSYAAILARPEWMRRFDKIHAQGRSLPRAESGRRWRELDSSMSSDALLMNVFCAPGVAGAVRRTLGVGAEQEPVFGWKARVPLASGRFDRTEVDMCWGDLLVEAKLTEGDFQTRAAGIVEGYRDLDAVFDRELLPRVELRTRRRRTAVEFAEEFTQEWEGSEEGSFPSGAEAPDFLEESMYGLKPVPFTLTPEPFTLKPGPSALEPEPFMLEPDHLALSAREREQLALEYRAGIVARARELEPAEAGYAGYQLIRNVLAAYASGTSFCVLHDERRPDLREQWFQVMAAVRSADMRTRLKAMTWQELVPLLPEGLKEFLAMKYGIREPGLASAVEH